MTNFILYETIHLVSQITNTASNCKGIKGNEENARKLLNLAQVDENVQIIEIPLNWDNQVVIIFIDTDGIEKELFAGLGNDGNYYLKVSVTEDFI